MIVVAGAGTGSCFDDARSCCIYETWAMGRTHRGMPNSSHLGDRLAIALVIAFGMLLLVLVLKLLLPWLMILAAIAILLKIWARHRQRGQALHTLFYELIQRNQGRVSVLEFAMTAQITGQAARSFLDARARDFWADFEPTQKGDVIYFFAIPQAQSEQSQN